MADIISVIQKPEWWFSTILVAVIANVAANYIYDWLRSHLSGQWLRILRFTYSTVLLGALIACSLVMPMKPQARFTIISGSALAFGFTLLEEVGFTKEALSGKFLFMQAMTVASLSSLVFLEPNFRNAWESKDTVWFASQIFAVIWLSIGISGIISLISMRQQIRKRRGLK
ncbi:hypothetical protein [Bradyrhizobium algeriense]|uniref:hypothetical protein n=1 Tax=Bradyrhizobium algeriense TaxID=634784 RepID=UPI0011AE1801|nr:hypothetical protein [Bradyrhizobium algeriense]